MKSLRQQYVDIIMDGDEDNEQELEFLESLTLKELEELAKNSTEPDEDL
jgi:hypothetical protein